MNKKHYEIAIVLHPDLEIDIETPLKKIETIITDKSGTIDKKDNWGKRKLAYRIKGQDWGVFVFFQVSLDPAQVLSISNTLKITDEVIRYLIVNLDNPRRVTPLKDKNKKPAVKADKSEAREVV